MLFEIALALVVGKSLHLIFEKIKQPGVIGEIIAGIILGPCIIGSFSGSSLQMFGTSMFNLQLNLTSHEFEEIAFIGVIFLLFIVGLETNTSDLKRSEKTGILTAVFGTAFSFFFGYFVGVVFQLSPLQSIAIGAIFVVTSITLTIRLLAEMDILSSRIGLTVHTADIIFDIIGIFILSFVLGEGHPVMILLRILLFFLIAFCVSYLVIDYAGKLNVSRRAPMMILTAGVVMCFLFGAFAENMGLAAIIGAFIAGMIIRRTPQASIISEYAETIGNAFFIPLFFVWVGASFNFLYLLHPSNTELLILFIIVFILFALVGKVVGCFIGAKLAGLNKKESLLVGVGMMPKLGVAVIIVTTEIEKGIFGPKEGALAQQIMVATLLLVIVSTFITPYFLKRTVDPSFVRQIRRKKKVAVLTKKFKHEFPILQPHTTAFTGWSDTQNEKVQCSPEHPQITCDLEKQQEKNWVR